MKTKLTKGILLILSLLCILCVPVTPVYAAQQGTDGSELPQKCGSNYFK